MVDHEGLTEAFLVAAAPAIARELRAEPDLELVLAQQVAQAEAAWPRLQLDRRTFAEHLARRLESKAALQELCQLHVADLYLAIGCALRVPEALAELEGRLLPEALKVVYAGDPHSSPEEVLQELRGLLLVGGDGTPALDAYRGRGTFKRWLRALALRCAMRLHRATKEVPLEPADLAEKVGGSDDPEIGLIKAHYREHANEAFREALQTLSRQERSVLRLYLVAGWNIEAIGTSYRVHRATVARWIAAAKKKLLAETLRALGARLTHSRPEEIASLMGWMQSQLDVSIAGYLKDPPDHE
ncbi:MAG: sigma-70 family RNA polymerase sigma factor [Deltaproteobacteria bacterium]|nr:sigma-70 family RNA polymerase sigma factor [Deltaproteobacteria bacterium]